MECIEVYLEHDNWKSANRELIMTAQYKTQNSNIQKHATVLNFKHRSWGFFCLITSSIRDETLFYYNGKQIGKEDGLRIHNETILKKSTDVFDSAIVFGQEPDSIRGSYDQYQSFIGDVSEFNIWNYVLNDAEISNMAKCMHNQKGNIVVIFFVNFKNNDFFTVSEGIGIRHLSGCHENVDKSSKTENL